MASDAIERALSIAMRVDYYGSVRLECRIAAGVIQSVASTMEATTRLLDVNKS